ncbi:MAG: hypothetical protein KGL57_08120, partial [Burkholderiales bacterium]|nr:hypothetical protein [Burkholderiales bacterium]
MTTPVATWRAWTWAVRALRVLLAVLLVLLVLVPALVWGLLHSEVVTRSVLPHLPGVRVWEPKGALLGDFSARRVEIDLPRGSLLSLDDTAWRDLRIHLDPDAEWHFGLHAASLSARLLQIKWVPNPHPTPTTDPYDLRLPLSVTVDRVQAKRGDSVLWSDHPLLDLDGRLELGQQVHRVDIVKVGYGPWTLKGKGQVQTLGHLLGTLDVAATGTYRQADKAWPVRAQVQAQGRLTELAVSTQVQVGTAPKTQSLDGTATLKLWAPWMLPALHVKASQFDLAALLDTLPRTALSGVLDWGGQGPDMQVKVDLRNGLGGDWQQGLLPLRQLQGRATLADAAKASSLEGMSQAGEVHLSAWLTGGVEGAEGGKGAEGQAQLDGTWDRRPVHTGDKPAQQAAPARRPNRLKLALQSVSLRALDGRAPALTLSGETTVSTERAWRQTDDLAQAAWDVVSDLSGQYAAGAHAASGKVRAQKTAMAPVQATLHGQWQPGRVRVDELTLRSEGAQASLKGQGRYAPPAHPGAPWTWQTQSQLQVKDFDPKVWLPWPDALT